MRNLFSKFSFSSVLERTGIALVAVSVLVLFLTFLPVLKEEVKYQFLPPQDATVVTAAEQLALGLSAEEVELPMDEEFGIVIPKIGANAPILPEVDWQNEQVYQRALTKGVAHAKGTATPDMPGNVFLFSHSGTDFLEASRYNAVFYLIDKLQAGDEIIIFYQKKKFLYRVTEKLKVSPDEVKYLTGEEKNHTLTLMTCYPAGTTLKRLLVRAELVTN